MLQVQRSLLRHLSLVLQVIASVAQDGQLGVMFRALLDEVLLLDFQLVHTLDELSDVFGEGLGVDGFGCHWVRWSRWVSLGGFDGLATRTMEEAGGDEKGEGAGRTW